MEHELQDIYILMVSLQNLYSRYVRKIWNLFLPSLNLWRTSWEHHHCNVETSIINVMLIILFFSEVIPYSVGLPMTHPSTLIGHLTHNPCLLLAVWLNIPWAHLLSLSQMEAVTNYECTIIISHLLTCSLPCSPNDTLERPPKQIEARGKICRSNF